MTKARAAPIAALVLIGFSIINTVLILKGQDENSKRANETRAIAVNNCRNIGTLAKVERAFITRQETQTQALLASGVTFGIPKEQLPKLLDASRKSQALFLAELDSLTVASCSPAGSLSTPIVKPHKARAAKPKTGQTGIAPVSQPSAPAGAAGTTTAARASPRTLAEHPRTGPHSAPLVPATQAASPSAQAPAAPPSAAPASSPAGPSPPTVAQPAPVSPTPPALLPVLQVPCVKTGVLTVC